jgi:cyclophilin family peptidyl-prolyl cis-trans isomerase
MPKSKIKPRCYFDISIDDNPIGRIVFELFADICPKTCENFIKLCTGVCGLGLKTGQKLCYQGSCFHRVVKGFVIQGGDFSKGDGTGGESIFGGTFADENLKLSHDRPYLLSMANRGVNTNGSQFFITTSEAKYLDGKHVIFGRVVDGENIVKKIEDKCVDSKSHRPHQKVTISHCGELVPVSKSHGKKKAHC